MQNADQGKNTVIIGEEKVVFLSLEEFADLKINLPYKKNLLRSMSPVRYCKIEIYPECIQGTIRMPKEEQGQLVTHTFGFYGRENNLFLVEDQEFLKGIFGKINKNLECSCNMRQLLFLMLDSLLEEDVLYLQEQEEMLAKQEEMLLKRIPEHFYERILRYRKRFMIFHAYYEQLMNLGDAMANGIEQISEPEEQAGWQRYTRRVERLHDHVEMLREYLVQIRELYQSLIDVQQNKVMSILTVVTTIFLPLTLIAGWYGMNFPNMPEFSWKYAYPVVIIVSITITVLEIVFFKKKKML